MNQGTGKYEFDVFRKKAITNVQVKPESEHDPKVLKGFVYRAESICSERYLDQEMQFLINVFVENGYKKEVLKNMVEEVKRKRRGQDGTTEEPGTDASTQTITLLWIPKISPRLRSVYKKASL